MRRFPLPSTSLSERAAASERFADARRWALGAAGLLGILAIAPENRPYVALGDSITAGQYVRTPYPNLLDSRVLNLGILGSTAAYAVGAELPQVTQNCALVTIWFGTNDARERMPPALYERAMRLLIEGARKRCPAARVLVATTPVNVAHGEMYDWLAHLNRIVRGFRDVTLVDLDADARLHDLALYRFDRIHPLQPAQDIIAEDFAAKFGTR